MAFKLFFEIFVHMKLRYGNKRKWNLMLLMREKLFNAR